MYQINTIADGIYSFDEGGVRSFLAVGTEKAALIDTGFGEVDFQKEIPLLTNLPVLLMNTHGDRDHTGKNALFSECYAAKEDWEQIQEGNPNKATRYFELKDGQNLDLGGKILTILSCPGHTPGSVMVYMEKERILFSGDSISQAPVWMFGEKRSLNDYRESLLRLQAMKLKVSLLLPSHGPCPLTGYESLLEEEISLAEQCIKGGAQWEEAELPGPGGARTVKLNSLGQAKMFTL